MPTSSTTQPKVLTRCAVGFKRKVRVPMTLSDGFHLPKNSTFFMAIGPPAQDEAVTPNPRIFEGFRHFNDRLKPRQNNLHQFITTDQSSMHFGHGKYACPGRFFASNVIKLILGHLLSEYEFRFPNGQGRPRNIEVLEYIFPDPKAQILFRKRAER